jgi:hypothetical protein
MAEARLYAIVIGGIVVGKRAAGVRGDGSFPPPLEAWQPVSAADYARLSPGWRQDETGRFLPPESNGDTGDPVRPDTPTEHLWRKEATLRAAIVDLKTRVEALEQERG